jgi:hypothetical protein
MSRSVSAAIFGVWVAVGVPAPTFANVLTDWDEKALVVVTPMASLGGTSPYLAQRMMGMVHAAMFDAVNAIERRYRPYLGQLPADPTTSEAAAAAVLATIEAKTAGEMKAALATSLASIPDGAAQSDGSGVRAVLGTADIPEIAVTSPTDPGVTHRWTNLTAFTEEVAHARIWAGFHYRFCARVGTDMEYQIGAYVVQSVMQPAVTGSR